MTTYPFHSGFGSFSHRRDHDEPSVFGESWGSDRNPGPPVSEFHRLEAEWEKKKKPSYVYFLLIFCLSALFSAGILIMASIVVVVSWKPADDVERASFVELNGMYIVSAACGALAGILIVLTVVVVVVTGLRCSKERHRIEALKREIETAMHLRFERGMSEEGGMLPDSSLFRGPLQATLTYRQLAVTGESDDHVRAVQRALRGRRFFTVGPIDGVYGLRTADAIRRFQKSKGLEIDGFVGPKTWTRLFSKDQEDLEWERLPAMDGVKFNRLLRNGTSGEDVAEMQVLLGQRIGREIVTLGDFDSSTELIVKEYQRQAGFEETGIVGLETMAALLVDIEEDRAISRLPKSITGVSFRRNISALETTGRDVAAIELRLQTRLGFDRVLGGRITGSYGVRVREGVKRFQEMSGLTVDGNVGPITWRKLFMKTKKDRMYDREIFSDSPEGVPFMRVLRLADRGPDVAAVQARLNRLGINSGVVDGVFGMQTKLALERFQEKRTGLFQVRMGIVDIQTWNLLFEGDRVNGLRAKGEAEVSIEPEEEEEEGEVDVENRILLRHLGTFLWRNSPMKITNLELLEKDEAFPIYSLNEFAFYHPTAARGGGYWYYLWDARTGKQLYHCLKYVPQGVGFVRFRYIDPNDVNESDSRHLGDFVCVKQSVTITNDGVFSSDGRIHQVHWLNDLVFYYQRSEGSSDWYYFIWSSRASRYHRMRYVHGTGFVEVRRERIQKREIETTMHLRFEREMREEGEMLPDSSLFCETHQAPLTYRQLAVIGESGDHVRAVQRALQGRRFFTSGPIDGVYGLRTADAIRRFQKSKGLEIDGFVGPKTWTRLFSKDQEDVEWERLKAIISTPGKGNCES